jgi:pimeloyl-ACP methyl ester carboxylesterase
MVFQVVHRLNLELLEVGMHPIYLIAMLYTANPTHVRSAEIQMATSVSDTITLDTPTGKIAGTLLVPAASGSVPLVVIIAGSGPTDRNGNSPLLPGANNSLKLLAEGLSERGIASLRYDKRGIGASATAMVGEANLRFDMYADDAAGWVRRLRSDSRFSTITVVGHSEGSLLGMLATQRATADGYVSIAGAGRAADKVLREQLGRQLPPDLLSFSNKALDALLAGHTVDSVPPALASIFRPSVQPYMISWLRVDPQIEIARLAVPALIIQGTLDAQVPQSDAQLLARAQPNAKLLMIDGMNHVFKRAADDQAAQRASYSDPSLPVAPELVDGIATFVKGVPRRR